LKTWHRMTLAVFVGALVGGAAAWQSVGRGFNQADIVNGSWSTSLTYGTVQTDSLTRTAVARRGLLALPSVETIYWQASRDSTGQPLVGNCTYALTGKAINARWWSVTYYDKAGYLVANPANIWSFSGASISEAEKASWRVLISPEKPAAGHWLPSAKGEGFDLTLRVYNAAEPSRAALEKTALPVITREGCA
jgi:hypothetical protein